MATLLRPDEAPAAAVDRPPLTDRARLALATGGAAIVLGVAGDTLVRGFQPGAGWALTLSLLLLAIGMLAARRGGLSPEQRLMLLPIVFLAESFAWRDAEALHVINMLALLVSLAALSMSLAAQGTWSVATAGFLGLIRACLHAAGSAIGGTVTLLFGDLDLRGLPEGTRAHRYGAIARGVLFTLPVLLVFGGLLMSADPMFERIVSNAFDLDLGDAMAHVIAIGAFTWLAAGYLRGSLLGAPLVGAGTRPGISAGIVEVGMALGAVNVLFLSFLLLQARYLFGGAEHVLATAGLTYAQYARSGFFELMFVAVLAIPLLMVSHALLRKDEGASLRTYRRLAALLALQVGVMLVSAGARMRLYVHEYGLTEDRIYASAVMIWLATVFAAFYVTVLRGRPRLLGGAALVTGWVTLAALNVANPDVLIARVNLERAAAGRPLDSHYLGSLGAGAVPLALSALPGLPEAHRCAVSTALLQRWHATPAKGWRDWNKARATARELVAAQRATLERSARLASSGAACGRDVVAAAPAAGVAGAAADEADIDAVAGEWLAALSGGPGGAPDWPRMRTLMSPDATVTQPGVDAQTVTAPGGASFIIVRRAIGVTGDTARMQVVLERVGAPDRGLDAFATASMTLRRAVPGGWRVTSVRLDRPLLPFGALTAP